MIKASFFAYEYKLIAALYVNFKATLCEREREAQNVRIKGERLRTLITVPVSVKKSSIHKGCLCGG